MPVLPLGQTLTKKWPVPDLDIQPDILLRTGDGSDFHCVTTWSKLNIRSNGVRLLDLAGLAQPKETATHILCYGYDDYTPNVSMDETLWPDVLLVQPVERKPLPKEHGGPVRMITPQLYAWKARSGSTD